MSNIVLTCINLHKSYPQASGELKILNGINLTIKSSETISIVGSSGSGKSTLLHILAGLDKATSGEILIGNQSLNQLTDNKICKIRNKKLGFIYQFHHLLPEFTALENTLMPLMINCNITKENTQFAKDILAKLGLEKRFDHYPSQLSGGERQRVAIARAVINNPELIFADEPTGNLDNQSANSVLETFFELQQEFKTSLVMVTHDISIAKKASIQYLLHDGLLNPKPLN